MYLIISGTNRPDSRTLEVAKIMERLYIKKKQPVEILDLNTIGLENLNSSHYGETKKPESIQQAIEKVNSAEGLVVVCPEYNGSMPGALKLFIDHWAYPLSFEHRAVSFVGLGGRWGGLRPVEHLQQVFGYRNSFQYPDRVFITNVWDVLKNGTIKDKTINTLLESQVDGFIRFTAGLKSQKLLAQCRD